MSRETLDQQIIVHYLLGELPEDKKDEFERQYLADDDAYDQLVATEDELILDYARGELTQEQRHQFETFFLNSEERRDHLEFAKTWIEKVAQGSKALSPAPSTEPQNGLATRRQALEARLRAAERRGELDYAAAAMVDEASSLGSKAGPQPIPLTDRRPGSRIRVLLTELRIRQSVGRWALAAACLVVVLGGSWLVGRLRAQLAEARSENARLLKQKQELEQQLLRQQVDQLRKEEELAFLKKQRPEENQPFAKREQSPSREDKGAQDALEKQSQLQPFIAAFVLAPGLTRGLGPDTKLVVPPTSGLLLLQLTGIEHKQQYQSYRAVLETVELGQIWSQARVRRFPPLSHDLRTQDQLIARLGVNRGARGLRADVPTVILELPSTVLKPGHNILTLQGLTASGSYEDVADYHFTVVPDV